ncbi:plasmid partitioning protein RepB [Bosea eneae]|uniref:Plasmid partitioning protein RepB n=1 Tax=Bosea eneae TaxID=151454 RepID=A0ABW0J110_9HYPH
MARRDIFRAIKEVDTSQSDRAAAPGYASRGASKNMLASINELAAKAAQAEAPIDGEVVQEIDPDRIEDSFVSDRLTQEDVAFEELVNGIRERGQDTPILVRPHPNDSGRYQTVFGHRRLRAARQLGRKVKAVVRNVSDEEHVIAQGQENSARENLTFIERALFAQRLIGRGHDRGTVQTALSVDAPMLTRMLSVSGRIEEDLLLLIGPANSIGRDRWLEFAQLYEKPSNRSTVSQVCQTTVFLAATSEVRFEMLLGELKKADKPRRASPDKPAKAKWQPADKALAAELVDTGKTFSVAFKSKDSARFGRFLAERLDALYGEFLQQEKTQV